MYQSSDTNGIYPIDQVQVNANQEDIDLIIAFNENGTNQLVLVEAKGTGSWNNKQLHSKAQKLQSMFGAELERCPSDVRIHFVLASPSKPQHISVSGWPKWMFGNDGRVRWIQLDIPDDRLQMTRCGSTGKPSRTGTYWTVRKGRER